MSETIRSTVRWSASLAATSLNALHVPLIRWSNAPTAAMTIRSRSSMARTAAMVSLIGAFLFITAFSIFGFNLGVLPFLFLLGLRLGGFLVRGPPFFSPPKAK
jgi:hypothetical protein